ncbi:MAG: ABC transporter ATPase [Candidatus Limiplasma sp.]|nr:ABC transporter ATPase [Candidatus Limiplasma sp.]
MPEKLLLDCIQKRNTLNEVYAEGEAGPGGAHHDYRVVGHGGDADNPADVIAHIQFQRGPRNDPASRHGVLDSDLLEMVRDRLKAFQQGEFATRENALALTHLEEALLWMAKRADDRAARNVLGTNKV